MIFSTCQKSVSRCTIIKASGLGYTCVFMCEYLNVIPCSQTERFGEFSWGTFYQICVDIYCQLLYFKVKAKKKKSANQRNKNKKLQGNSRLQANIPLIWAMSDFKAKLFELFSSLLRSSIGQLGRFGTSNVWKNLPQEPWVSHTLLSLLTLQL